MSTVNKMLILVKPDEQGSGNADLRCDWMRRHVFESASVFLSPYENPSAFHEKYG